MGRMNINIPYIPKQLLANILKLFLSLSLENIKTVKLIIAIFIIFEMAIKEAIPKVIIKRFKILLLLPIEYKTEIETVKAVIKYIIKEYSKLIFFLIASFGDNK